MTLRRIQALQQQAVRDSLLFFTDAQLPTPGTNMAMPGLSNAISVTEVPAHISTKNNHIRIINLA